MARPLRLEYPGALYHVTSRGNARQRIFRDDRDRETFLELLGQVIKRFGWLCHGYCLMENHYHLLIETPLANLSAGMRHLNGLYTQRYNLRHRTVGHVTVPLGFRASPVASSDPLNSDIWLLTSDF